MRRGRRQAPPLSCRGRSQPFALERARAGPRLGSACAASSRSGARCSVRLCARRTGRPPRNSTTVIPHSAIVNIQKRSSGRSNSVSSATLNTPSWPTRIDHGCSARCRARVAADLRPAQASRAGIPAEPLEQPARAGRTRASTCGERFAAGRPGPSGSRRHRSSTSPQRSPISAWGGPPTRPGRSRGSPGSGSDRDGLAGRSRLRHRARDRLGGLGRRARAASGRSRAAGRPGRAAPGDACGARAARRRARPAADRVAESGVSAWPWNRPSR